MDDGLRRGAAGAGGAGWYIFSFSCSRVKRQLHPSLLSPDSTALTLGATMNGGFPGPAAVIPRRDRPIPDAGALQCSRRILCRPFLAPCQFCVGRIAGWKWYLCERADRAVRV